MKNIPLILHQMAPRDESQWHPIWRPCQQSWLEHFSGFEYQMWDAERTELFVKEKFPERYAYFSSCPLHIIKIDLARFMILSFYGGVYADMDMYCYRNFYAELDKEVHLAETLNQHNDELVQNSLMAGIPGHSFFDACLNEAIHRLRSTDHALITKPDAHAPDLPMSNFYVRAIAGPILLSHVYSCYPYKAQIGLLPKETYNGHHLTYKSDYRTKHMVTGRWGEVVLEALINRKKMRQLSMTDKEYEKQDYLEFRSVNVDTFDFRKNYLGE